MSQNPNTFVLSLETYMKSDTFNRKIVPMRMRLIGRARQLTGDDDSAEDDIRLIERIVNALPPLQSRIFRMKEMEGYEADEIMAITGCTPESLRQNLSRARRRIREEFLRITTLRGL
ncbi:MAG: sigma-70 family RNA polymerase sigma factor [Prevotella sp.]|nr:sigma-70 family RNA polymerase sigma factor [Prevotella sp.]